MNLEFADFKKEKLRVSEVKTDVVWITLYVSLAQMLQSRA